MVHDLDAMADPPDPLPPESIYRSVYWPMLRRWLTLVAAVCLSACVGLHWPIWPLAPASSAWPAAGIALAGLLVCGWQFWPAVWLGRCLAGWIWAGWTGLPLGDLGWVALLSAAGMAAVQSALAARCVLDWGWWPTRLRRGVRLARLVAWAVATALINPGLVAVVRALAMQHGVAEACEQWWVLSLSDALGMALLMPLGVLWTLPGAWRDRRCRWVTVLTLCGVAASVVAGLGVAQIETKRAQHQVHHQAERVADVLCTAWTEAESRLKVVQVLHDPQSPRYPADSSSVAAKFDRFLLGQAVAAAGSGGTEDGAGSLRALHFQLSRLDAQGVFRPVARVPAGGSADNVPAVGSAHWLHADLVPRERLRFEQAGGAWLLDVGGDADFWVHNASHRPGLVIAAGLALTALLMSLALVATGRHELLEAQVATATIELDQSLLLLEDAVEGYLAQSQQLKLVLRSTPAGFMAFDAEAQVVFVNAALAGMLALDEDVLSGMSRQEVTEHLVALCPADAAVANRLLREDGDEPQQRPARLRVMRGSEVQRVLEVTRSSVSDAQLRSVFLVADVSEAVQLERSKTQFIANIAHEIRTPLTSISGYAQLLMHHAQSDPVRRDTMLRELLTMSGRLNDLMGSMLDLAELETVGAVGLERKPTDLAALVTETLGRISRPDGREPPVWQPPSDGPTCLLNPRKVALALRHLLANAYAFSAAPSSVWVGLMVECADGQSPHAVLTVTDQGIGMSAEQVAQAFERFYRADTSGEKPGFGLGLAIVRLVVELHQGQVSLSSVPGQGTQVTVLLPLAPPADPAPAARPA